jgi:hypothetical protein
MQRVMDIGWATEHDGCVPTCLAHLLGVVAEERIVVRLHKLAADHQPVLLVDGGRHIGVHGLVHGGLRRCSARVSECHSSSPVRCDYCTELVHGGRPARTSISNAILVSPSPISGNSREEVIP